MECRHPHPTIQRRIYPNPGPQYQILVHMPKQFLQHHSQYYQENSTTLKPEYSSIFNTFLPFIQPSPTHLHNNQKIPPPHKTCIIPKYIPYNTHYIIYFHNLHSPLPSQYDLSFQNIVMPTKLYILRRLCALPPPIDPPPPTNQCPILQSLTSSQPLEQLTTSSPTYQIIQYHHNLLYDKCSQPTRTTS